MTHQPENLVYHDNAWYIVGEAVSSNAAQHLRVGDGLQDRIAFHLMKGKDTGFVIPPERQIDVGLSIRKFCKWSSTAQQTANLVSEIVCNLLHQRVVTQPGQDIDDRIDRRCDVRRDSGHVGVEPL